jgi:hypothetical protein
MLEQVEQSLVASVDLSLAETSVPADRDLIVSDMMYHTRWVGGRRHEEQESAVGGWVVDEWAGAEWASRVTLCLSGHSITW